MSPDLLQPTAPPTAPQAASPAMAPRVAVAPAAAEPEPAPPVPNPRLRLDPLLSLVVIEFRDSGGEVSQSIPSARELAAYRDQRSAEPAPVPALDVSR